MVKITVKPSEIDKALEVLDDYTRVDNFIVSKEPEDTGVFAELNLEEANIPFMVEFKSDTEEVVSVFMPDEGCVYWEETESDEEKEDFERVKKLFLAYLNG